MRFQIGDLVAPKRDEATRIWEVLNVCICTYLVGLPTGERLWATEDDLVRLEDIQLYYFFNAYDNGNVNIIDVEP